MSQNYKFYLKWDYNSSRCEGFSKILLTNLHTYFTYFGEL